MASATFPPLVGGDGSTVTDDNNPTTGLGNGGHRYRFVPALYQMVQIALSTVTKALEAAGAASSASASASASANSAAHSENSSNVALNAASEAEAAWTAALAANPDLNPVIRMNPTNVDSDITIPSFYNSYSVGAITISDGVTVTLNDNAQWSIL